jgi:hypothetical protein
MPLTVLTVHPHLFVLFVRQGGPVFYTKDTNILIPRIQARWTCRSHRIYNFIYILTEDTKVMISPHMAPTT